MPIFQLTQRITFPPPHLAGPEGLLAVGGDLSEERLLLAYRMGIFPWYSEDDPILWWSPDPRMVLFPDEFRISRSLRKFMRRGLFAITFDNAFAEVVDACAAVRKANNEGTWILPDMATAYMRLYERGVAHSVEVRHRGELAGGLYGISLGGCFFGESMFFRISNASKAALIALVAFLKRNAFDLIDCQVRTAHLQRLGGRAIPRKVFLERLQDSMKRPTIKGRWLLPKDIREWMHAGCPQRHPAI